MSSSQASEANELKKPPVTDKGSAYGYQEQDKALINYNIWNLWTPHAGFTLRGPRPKSLAPGSYCTSLGAAFTFGRFTPHPYAHLLGSALNISSLNLGFSGVGPSFYNDPQNRALFDIINQSKFVTIAIFSGRSQASSRFKTARYSQEQYILENGDVVPADFAYQQLLETASEQEIDTLIAETRLAYLSEFFKLLSQIQVPKVLIWFSKRSPHYEVQYNSVYKLLSGFPHLVNQQMVDTLKPWCDAYVEYVSTEGLPQPFISRATQQPISIMRPRTYENGKLRLTPSPIAHNRYYASPEMHQGLTQQLIPICRQWL